MPSIEHDHDGVPPSVPARHLACTHCGHGFSVQEGEKALTTKRRLQAGYTEDPDATRKAFRESAAALAKAWPR